MRGESPFPNRILVSRFIVNIYLRKKGIHESDLLDFQGDSGSVLFAADYLPGEEAEEVGTEGIPVRRKQLALWG